MVNRLLRCFGRGSSSSSFDERGGGNVNPTSSAVASSEQYAEGQGPVMVELFSSQGCATSPEAEVMFSRLGRGDFERELPPVILLAFHVDYWDYMGWKDPYGWSGWTVRQKNYVEALQLDTMFTPQVVVQGRAHCVGNEEDSLLKTIAGAQRYSAPAFQVKDVMAKFHRPTSDSLQVSLTGALRTKVDNNGADIMVALYESGLVNDCPKGDNKGKLLSNDFVVRKLQKLCSVKDTSAKKTVTGTVHFTLWEGFNTTKCGVAVFVQNSSRQIFGSQNFKLPDDI